MFRYCHLQPTEVLRRLQKNILVVSGFHKDVSLEAAPLWCLENKDAIRLKDPKYLAKSQIIKTHVFKYIGLKGNGKQSAFAPTFGFPFSSYSHTICVGT